MDLKKGDVVMAKKRIFWGITLLIVGLLTLLFAFGGEFTLEQFLKSYRLVVLLLGIVFTIFGLVLYIDGRTILQQRKMNVGADRRREVRHPQKFHDIPHHKIPETKDLEEPKKKECPECKKHIYKDAKVCRFCGHEFKVTYILKVFAPEDKERFDLLVKKLSARLKKPTDEIEHLLEVGMRFKSPTVELLKKNRIRFERFGCRIESYKKVSRH